MNERLRPRDLSQSSGSPALSQRPSPASKLVGLAQAHPLAASQLHQQFKIAEYQLGNSIATDDFHWICAGRVRLLCHPPDRTRETTALLLEAEDTFGADALFSSHDTAPDTAPLSYRAVAASPVQVASISAAQLALLLAQFPQLHSDLQRQFQQRDRLIFFKLYTLLRSLPAVRLKQLESEVFEQFLPVDSRLTELIPGDTGIFWLRQGKLYSPQVPSPVIGETWNHLTQDDWVTQTEVRLYGLPSAAWETAKAMPELANLELARMNGDRNGLSGSSRLSLPNPGALSLPSPIPEPAQPASGASEPFPVAFPKPIQRRLLDSLHRYPWVEQQSSSDCGAACLGMISRYWGKSFPLHVLRERSNVGLAGASLKSLATAAEGLGFHARPVRASLSRLAEQANPWIAHWQGSHYVVVYQVQENQVIIADPAVGRRSLSREAFQHQWSGYALLLDKTDRLQATEIKQASLGRYLTAILPYRNLALQVILVSVLIQIFGLITPLFTQIILDQVVVQKSLSTLNVFILGLLLFSVWGICMGGMRQYLLSYFSNRLDLTLVSGFIRHTLSLPLPFFESRRVGDVITRVQENQKIQRFLIGQVVLAWLDFVTGFVYLGLMLYYNWRLTLLVLALIPPIVLLTLGSTPFLQRISREIFNEATDQNSSLVEMITGISTIKSSAAERELRWRWEDHLTRQMNAVFRGQKLGVGLQVMSGIINSLGSTLLLWYGARLVIQGQLTIGQFVAFNMMVGYVISPVISLANLWDELQEVLISVERLNDVFEAAPEESPQRSLLVLPAIEGEIQFDNVTFRYGEDEEHNTLQNISFAVHPGQTVAIVGRSGSGKSTLVKLLQGLYHPNRGRITVDGHDIRHVSASSLRSQLGVVPQECFLFSGTILENITLYRSEFALEQVVEVAKLAEAHPFIQALPLGYNTKVGERGCSLSGGQQQRIAIARALLGNPRIVMLDEATSSLDTESERKFQHNLAQISRDRVTFIIAHRLSTVRNADQILVIDRGILAEQGTHLELMAIQGLYYYFVQQQLDL